MKKPELLAPAGDLERLKWAIMYGADAVYLGGSVLGLRANATNFTIEEMREGVEFAHERGKKVYVTVNSILHNQELSLLDDYLKQLEAVQVDALIVADPYVIRRIQAVIPTMEIHLSTQQSTLNCEAVNFWYKQGITRIVLGREVNRDEMKEILQSTDAEIEVFIHGSMCAFYSGRCVLSNYLTARDANRGGCSQICRWDFDFYDSHKQNRTGEKPFTMCTKDLSMLRHIPELIAMGVTSFKIEGRMRSIYYLATVVDIYRKVIDESINNCKQVTYNKNYEQILRNVANRDSVPQFFEGNPGMEGQYYNGRMEVSNQDFLAVVLDYDTEKNEVILEERNYFKVGDDVQIFGPNRKTITFTIPKIMDQDGVSIQVARHPKQIIRIPFKEPIEKNCIMRMKRVDIS